MYKAWIQAVALSIMLMPSLVLADELASNPALTKTWMFDAGAIYQNVGGDVGAHTSSGAGGTYDWSRLGLDDEDTSLLLGMRYRFSDRWRMDLAFDEIEVDGSVGNSSTIEFGRITIPAGYEISSSVSMRVYSANFGFAFSKSQDYELGARIGANVVDVDSSVGGTAWAGSTKLVAGPQEVGITQFMPTVGLYTSVALTDRLALEGAVDGIVFNLADYSGHYLATSGAVSYWITDSMAISVGYRYLDADVEHDGSGLDEEVGVHATGPFAKAAVAF